MLRLASGDPTHVEVAVGTETDSFKRDKFDHIVVEAGGDDDAVGIDESNGIFTGGPGTDTLDGGPGSNVLIQ